MGRSSQTYQKSNIDVFGCAETNIAWTEAKRKYAQHIIQTELKQANLLVSRSNDIGTSDYQPGGIASCITGKYTGRILQ
jgi:hypothetical protein